MKALDNNKKNNLENIPTNKIPIKDEQNDYYEIEKNKDYIISKFGGTPRTILSSVISGIYEIVFLVLLIIFNEKNYSNDYFNIGNCMRLKRWNRALYISLAISFVFLIVCTVLQIINKEKEKFIAYLLLIRTLFNYIVGLFFLIAITVVYFGIDSI